MPTPRGGRINHLGEREEKVALGSTNAQPVKSQLPHAEVKPVSNNDSVAIGIDCCGDGDPDDRRQKDVSQRSVAGQPIGRQLRGLQSFSQPHLFQGTHGSSPVHADAPEKTFTGSRCRPSTVQ